MWARLRAWWSAARHRDPSAYETYSRVTSFPLFALSLLFLIAFAIKLEPAPAANDEKFASIVIPVTWAFFAADYVFGLLISPRRWDFIKSHLLLTFALLFPPLRILMLFHVFQVLHRTPAKRGDRARMYLIYITTLLLVMASILVVYFERASPNANITSFGNALWWGGETVSTVGYGDFYPVTIGGRLVAAVLFVNGVALVGVITAALAQNFTSGEKGEGESAQSPSTVDLTAMKDRVEELEGKLAEANKRLAERARSDLASTLDTQANDPDDSSQGT